MSMWRIYDESLCLDLLSLLSLSPFEVNYQWQSALHVWMLLPLYRPLLCGLRATLTPSNRPSCTTFILHSHCTIIHLYLTHFALIFAHVFSTHNFFYLILIISLSLSLSPSFCQFHPPFLQAPQKPWRLCLCVWSSCKWSAGGGVRYFGFCPKLWGKNHSLIASCLLFVCQRLSQGMDSWVCTTTPYSRGTPSA